MGRKVSYGDTTIQSGGGGPDKDRRFRGVKGTTFVIRVVSECEEVREHFVDDVLEGTWEDGSPKGFNIMCSREWDEEEEDFVGDCEGCDRDYEIKTKYVSIILVLGLYKGKSTRVQTIDPENAVYWWDYGADKFRQLSDIYLDLQRSKKPKELKQVELTVKTNKEHFQDLTIAVSQADPLMDKSNAKDYLACYKDESPGLLAEILKVPSIQEQKRRLKPKKKRDSSGEGDALEDEPRTKKKAKRRSKKPEPEDEPEETEDGDLDDLLDEL